MPHPCAKYDKLSAGMERCNLDISHQALKNGLTFVSKNNGKCEHGLHYLPQACGLIECFQNNHGDRSQNSLTCASSCVRVKETTHWAPPSSSSRLAFPRVNNSVKDVRNPIFSQESEACVDVLDESDSLRLRLQGFRQPRNGHRVGNYDVGYSPGVGPRAVRDEQNLPHLPDYKDAGIYRSKMRDQLDHSYSRESEAEQTSQDKFRPQMLTVTEETIDVEWHQALSGSCDNHVQDCQGSENHIDEENYTETRSANAASSYTALADMASADLASAYAVGEEEEEEDNDDEEDENLEEEAGSDHKEDDQPDFSQDDGPENAEQKKFSKSYWRKQRRLRLKERLLAEKILLENNPNLAVEERENTKPQKGVKSKEIDYDSYLPAHVLMHVKRDLVSVLMEYGQTREVKVSFKDMERSGPHHLSRFHTAAVVDGETFPVGSGSSKKNAKKAAAAQALKIMYDRGRKNLEVVNEIAHKKLKAMTPEEVGSHAHRVVLISRHVLETAEETQFINYSKDKIAATFVLEYHGRMRVVGLGTGNRCILYQHMTLDGKRVIHSHAEIIARRAFLRYLYKQLLTYNGNCSHPIFTRSDTGKLKLRDKIQVHLYISRPPCGDAAAFPTISNFPNKMRAIRKQGQLRTIIDDGEGAIPTDFPVPAGANGKERLRIMTCSDKICRWNVLGVQGALLSHFLDPIFITSLVIGSHTGDQRGHVPRAVSGRLKCGRLHEVIQRPYHINTPDIHYPHDDLADNYNITKSKQYCITWSYGDADAEVIDAITGVTNMETMDEVVPSRVAKVTLYSLFQQVCRKYGQHDLAGQDYLKAKRAASTFQRMKNFVGQHLAAMGFGQWYSLQDTYGTDSLSCPGPC